MELPTDYQNYVYLHINPINNEVIYVGVGTKDRAWHYRVSMSRHKEHTKFLNYLTEQGHIPSDWVEVVERGLSKEDARLVEKRLISKYNPTFNTHKGQGSCINMQMKEKALQLKEEGIVGSQAAKQLGCSIMTAWRYQYVY